MPRRTALTDHRQRPRRVATRLEIRQRDTIDHLKAELRAAQAELAAVLRPTGSVSALQNAESYTRFLDQIGRRIDRLIDKGRTYHGTCTACGNIALPCTAPLIEMERMDYENGDCDGLIFPPYLGAIGIAKALE